MVDDLFTTESPTEQSILNKASKDKFVLVLNLPRALKQEAKKIKGIDLDPMQISIYGTVTPTITVPAIAVPYGGQVPTYSSHTRPQYSPLTVNFVVDNEYKNFYFLWRWLELLNDARKSKYSGPPERLISASDKRLRGDHTDYQTTFSILALNEYNQTTIEFVYYYAFITSLGAISYNYRDGEILESTAEFSYGQLDLVRTDVK